MKALVLTSRNEPDYLGSCLWDGLQEVLGEENVVDGVGSPWLHRSGYESKAADSPEVVQSLSGSREGKVLYEGGHYKHDDFDLAVIFSSVNREPDWHGLLRIRLALLKPEGKVAWVEGWDAAWQVQAPPPDMRVDAYFRKEIASGITYPMAPHHLNFAAPRRWFMPGTHERTCDVFFLGNPDACLPGHSVRRPMLANVFRTRRSFRAVIATHRIGHAEYFRIMRKSKLALCPSSADLADSLRTFEAAACGAVPVFVGYPNHHRDPWFPNEACISCTADTLAEHIDEALAHDLAPRRKALLEHSLKYHTTAARARQMLDVLGLTILQSGE